MKIKEVMGVGDTLEEAKKDALSQLDEEYDSTEFEILKQPEKKKFGLFGGSEAQVKLIAKKSEGDEVKKFLTNIVDKFNIPNLTIEEINKEKGVIFNIDGDELGALIGYRGETLGALQYLTGLVANKTKDSFYRVNINIGTYRQKRERGIEIIAKKNASQALRYRKNISCEPMNSYERRLVHTTVQEIKGVKSWSEGEGRNRHVVIGIDGSVPAKAVNSTDSKDDGHSLYEKIN